MKKLRRIASKLSVVTIVICSCYSEDIPRIIACSDDLMISATSQNTSGCNLSDGAILATAVGGLGNYRYSIDGGSTQQVSGSFLNLAGGTYLVIVYDGSECPDSTEVQVMVTGSSLAAGVQSISPDTDCLNGNGSVDLDASGGVGGYTFKLGTKTNATGVFSGLASGLYDASVSDANCSLSISFTIPADYSTSYHNEISPILTAKCNYAECHGDNNPKRLPEFTTYNTVFAYRLDIRTKILNNLMPKKPKPDLTTNELELIVCWIDAGAKNN